MLPGVAGGPERPNLAAAAAPVRTVQRLTRTGVVMGTPAHMAPEQADGGGAPVDGRSDVYALGSVLCELTTGRAPYAGGTPLEVLYRKLAQDPVPPRRVQPNLGADVETIILKAREREPDRRYATAAELARDLARSLEGEAILARPSSRAYRVRRWVGRNRAFAVAGRSALVLLAVGGVWVAGERGLRAEAAALAADPQRKAEESARRAEERRQALVVQLRNVSGRSRLRILRGNWQSRQGPSPVETFPGALTDLNVLCCSTQGCPPWDVGRAGARGAGDAGRRGLSRVERQMPRGRRPARARLPPSRARPSVRVPGPEAPRVRSGSRAASRRGHALGGAPRANRSLNDRPPASGRPSRQASPPANPARPCGSSRVPPFRPRDTHSHFDDERARLDSRGGPLPPERNLRQKRVRGAKDRAGEGESRSTRRPAMKPWLTFGIGIVIGAVGSWWMLAGDRAIRAPGESGPDVRQVKKEVFELDRDQILADLKRTGEVVRRRAREYGEVIADVAADAGITATIKAKLIRDPHLSAWNIGVSTTAGRVYLTGEVESADQISETILLVMETQGVRDVVSTIRLKAAEAIPEPAGAEQPPASAPDRPEPTPEPAQPGEPEKPQPETPEAPKPDKP